MFVAKIYPKDATLAAGPGIRTPFVVDQFMCLIVCIVRKGCKNQHEHEIKALLTCKLFYEVNLSTNEPSTGLDTDFAALCERSLLDKPRPSRSVWESYVLTQNSPISIG